MRLIYLPDVWTLLLCFIVWPIFQIGAAVLCKKIPNHFYTTNKWLCKTFAWENDGRIYRRILKVAIWKKYLPDAGSWTRDGYSKKKIMDYSPEYLGTFLIESRRAELIHLIAIIPFWTFGIFVPQRVIWYMLVYAILINVPCMIVQRYNRPRIIRLIEKIT